MKEMDVSADDESSVTEINILPDGRIFLFGASQQVLDVLAAIPLEDRTLKSRIERIHTADAGRTEELHGACAMPPDGAENP